MSNPIVQKLISYDELNKALLSIQKELSETEAYKTYVVSEKLMQKSLDNCVAANARATELNSNFNSIQSQYDQIKKIYDEIAEVADECIDDTELSYHLNKLNDLQKKADNLIKQLEKMAQETKSVSKDFADNLEKYKTYRTSRINGAEQFKQIKAEKDIEIKDYQKRMREIAAGLPKELVENYDNLRKAKKYPMIAKYLKTGRGPGNCAGCYMQVVIQTDVEINEKGYDLCPNCNRILYIE